MPSRKLGKRMTQSEIINQIAEKTVFSRDQVKEILDELANLASREVKTNDEFVLPGFGKLVLSQRKARQGRNPATGETIQIAAKTSLKFRITKGLKGVTMDSGLGGESTIGSPR